MRTIRSRTILLFSLVVLAASARAAEIIQYSVTPDPAAKKLHVSIRVPRVNGSIRVQMPAWSPGAYMIGNYASGVTDLRMSGPDGGTIPVTHPDSLTWEASTGKSAWVDVAYDVADTDQQMDGDKPKRCHIRGPSSLMYVVGRKPEPVKLSVTLPAGWKIANSLDPDPSAAPNQALFNAPNYDVLIDAPTEMGDFAEDDFAVRGVPHKIALYGEYTPADRAKLLDYCKRIAEAEIAFFNDVPFKRYIFMFQSAGGRGRGAGGLEHLGSTEIGLRGEVEDRARSVIAHEYFHLWNVKRIRPAVLGPFDYTGPCRTSNLWWAEEVTSYYGDLLSRRGGLNTDDEYLKHLADTIALLQGNPARLKVTADESSYKVWDGGGGSQGYGRLSYYTKGELIGLCLDLKIRQVTAGKHSLDDVMKSLYKQCGKGNGPGFGEDDIKTTVNRIAGQDLSAFYDLLARSTQEMPFEECLGYAGLTLNQSDKVVTTPVPGMFAEPEPESRSLRVRFLTPGGAGDQAGLKSGDLILLADGKPVAERLGRGLTGLAAGEKLTLTIERNGSRQELTYTVGSESHRVWTITPSSTTSPTEIRMRTRWLTGR